MSVENKKSKVILPMSRKPGRQPDPSKTTKTFKEYYHDPQEHK